MSDVKYYPDRFYIKLDGFDTEKLTSFITDFDLGREQSIFIHEYYHYVTNIATFPGVRQFVVNFCDRFSLITNFTGIAGLDAYPLASNTREDCANHIEYWNTSKAIRDADDLDYEISAETQRSATRKFEILGIKKESADAEFWLQGKLISGSQIRIIVEIDGLTGRNSFDLTFGALDEFLSSAIDEYLFEKDIADVDPRLLNDRPYYPYRMFDDLLLFYHIRCQSATEKILIAYYALNSHNPPLALIELLESMRDGGYEIFVHAPESYLAARKQSPDMEGILKVAYDFADQCMEHGRVNIGQAIRYYVDRFYIAHQLKASDFFYFIRPFLVNAPNEFAYKQKFLLALSRIIQVFTPPLILTDGSFKYIDKLTTMGEATTHIIAVYEILESLQTNRIAKRPQYLKDKYWFPENDPNCDDISQFQPPPINGSFKIALLEIGLYPLYLEEARKARETPQ